MTTAKPATQLRTLGLSEEFTQGGINPIIQRTSSIVFPSTAAQKQAAISGKAGAPYGRGGTNTHFALAKAITTLEGGAGTKLYPSGLAAISGSILPFVTSGDHVLVADCVYAPVQQFCRQILTGIGVDFDFFSMQDLTRLPQLIRPNTKVIYLETPSSVLVEFNDAPQAVKIAKAAQPQIVAIADNTWGAGILFKPLQHGFDISLQSGTKYLVGHSDYFIGLATANDRTFERLHNWHLYMGLTVDPDTAYMALRGLRTLDIRLQQHFKNSTAVAVWLAQHPLVATVNHPRVGAEANSVWQRYFSGGNGLFCTILNRKLSTPQLQTFTNALQHFKTAYSWGGFESLLLSFQPEYLQTIRPAGRVTISGSCLRLHIGLEDPQDLIDDLANALDKIGV